MPKPPPAPEVVTGKYQVGKWVGGVCAPMHGSACYERLGGDRTNQMYGLSPEDLLGRELGDGAVIEVSVRVVREGKTIHNPWLRPDGGPNYGCRGKVATAKTCHICNPKKTKRG